MAKVMEAVHFLQSLFYGDEWFIYWGIVAVLIIVPVAIGFPKFVKSLKEHNKRKQEAN